MNRIHRLATTPLLVFALLILLTAACSPFDREATPTVVSDGSPAEPAATRTAPTAAPTAAPAGATPTLVPTLPPATTRPSATPPLPATAQPAATPSAELLATMEAIEFQVEALRDLELSAPLTHTLMSRDDLAERVEREFEEDYPPEEVETDTRVLAVLDMAPEDIDLHQVLVDLYSTQILGMYDDEENSFLVVSAGEFDLSDRLTYAHEYVHGLQDEHFGLETFVDEDLYDDDENLARLALVEGDATLAMSQYLWSQMGNISQEEMESLQEQPEGSQAALEAAPPIVQETLAFPYSFGTEFVRILQADGWDDVNAAFADPPQSTEQIMHPEKYLAREEPQLVSLPPLTDTLGTGWQRIEDNKLGEFQMAVYLLAELDGDMASAATGGWGGDRYAVYTRDDDELLVLDTVWDSVADREEFVAAYEQYATSKYGAEADRQEIAALWWESEAQVTVLAWSGERAAVVVAPDAELAARALAALGLGEQEA